MSNAYCTCGHQQYNHLDGKGICHSFGVNGQLCMCERFIADDDELALAQAENADLRAQLAAAQERVKELEVELGNLNMLIEFYKPSFTTAMGVTLGDIIKGVEALKQLAQRDAEIARLNKDQQWLDPGAVELIKAFGSFSIERLPDWNFAVAIDGDIYGIGMTVFDAISSAAAQIDKIKETRKEAGE